jgi:hypothetical protein
MLRINPVLAIMQQQHQQQKQEQEQSKQSSQINYGHRALQALKTVLLLIISNPLLHIILYFIMCNIAHHLASKLYLYFCITDHRASLPTLAMSPFTIISPHCIAIRWVMMESANLVYFQILMVGSWIVARIS